jgi:hypothetical protein
MDLNIVVKIIVLSLLKWNVQGKAQGIHNVKNKGERRVNHKGGEDGGNKDGRKGS